MCRRLLGRHLDANEDVIDATFISLLKLFLKKSGKIFVSFLWFCLNLIYLHLEIAKIT